jgi:hypothetical protein
VRYRAQGNEIRGIDDDQIRVLSPVLTLFEKCYKRLCSNEGMLALKQTDDFLFNICIREEGGDVCTYKVFYCFLRALTWEISSN